MTYAVSTCLSEAPKTYGETPGYFPAHVGDIMPEITEVEGGRCSNGVGASTPPLRGVFHQRLESGESKTGMRNPAKGFKRGFRSTDPVRPE